MVEIVKKFVNKSFKQKRTIEANLCETLLLLVSYSNFSMADVTNYDILRLIFQKDASGRLILNPRSESLGVNGKLNRYNILKLN